MSFIFSSESVTEGHPDKVADQISDGVLDAILAKDKNARVACETMVSTGLAIISGEITTSHMPDVQDIARETIRNIGYDDPSYGYEADSISVLASINKQSSDIAMGVDREGAGDQGMMFGFACKETKELMPLPISVAHRLVRTLSEARKKGTLPYLRPDGKAQVSVSYSEKGKPEYISAIVLSTQHDPNVSQAQIKKDMRKHVIDPVCGKWLSKKTRFHINPTGRFVIGGPPGDCGLTGRKIIVDTYGGSAPHGGGAFSGKDPSKVDRSACYMTRYVAKNIVAAGLAERALVQVAYAIGVVRPVSLLVSTEGTGHADERKIAKAVEETFDLTPKGIIKTLNLKKPIYQKTAAYGHFGRSQFPWEKTDKATILKKLCS